MTIETRYRCTKCRFERSLVSGTSWQHVDELHRYKRDISRGRYGDTAKKWLNRYPEAMLSVSNAIFQCRRCGTVAVSEYLCISSCGFSWELPVRCPSCRAPAVKIDTPPPEMECTACGGVCKIVKS